MIRFKSTTRCAAAATLVLLMRIPTSLAHAQQPEVRSRVAPLSLRQSAIEHARRAAAEPQAWSPAPAAQTGTAQRERSTTRKIVGAALGATAGLFAGGYLGAVIEGDRCHCDDPGLQGALIGAPIGTVVGGILGALFF